jgi:hypothetical protein
MNLCIGLRQLLGIITVIALLLIPNAQASAKSSTIDHQFRSAIAKVRRTKTAVGRLDAAEHLAALTVNCDCGAVTDATIHSIVSLLNINDDGVRMWVAAALGDFGGRAKEAIPKLLSIYSVGACEIWDQGSPATIPIALAKMGVTAPVPNCRLRWARDAGRTDPK